MFCLAENERDRYYDRLSGCLLGTAIGDALGLPMEGMRPETIARIYPHIDRYYLLASTGFVSDDTEQSALIAQALSRSATLEACVQNFRRSLLGWFLRLPWGIGWGTLKACLRIALGFRRSGVRSAGNGAAMRAAIVGAYFYDQPQQRRSFSDALAQVTHVDARAIEGARFVAELAAICMASELDASRVALVRNALVVVHDVSLQAAIERALTLAEDSSGSPQLDNTGFVLHSIELTTYVFLRYGDNPIRALAQTVYLGGDTDTHAAIVGGLLGALHGAQRLPTRLISNLHDGPFGPTHLRQLANDLVGARDNTGASSAKYAWVAALLRNLALYPVVVVHACRVLIGNAKR